MKTPVRSCLAKAVLAATAALGAVASAESCRADAFSAVRHGENVGGAPRAAPAVKAVVCVVERSGSWKDSMEELSDAKVSGRVFEIVIPHGRRPVGASCSWRVMPSSSGIIEN